MPEMSNQPSLVRLVVSLAVCVAVGSINAFFALPLIPTWFATLQRPAFLPPDAYLIPFALFVYLILGFALYLLWQTSSMNPNDRTHCILFIFFTLIMLDLWGYLFFGLESPLLGVIASVLVIAMIMATMIEAVKISFGAALLLFPLVIIVFFVAYANYLIVQLNPLLPVLGV